jgi:hypothetical protein
MLRVSSASIAGQCRQPPNHSAPCLNRAADQQDRVVAGDRTQYVWPRFTVDGGGDWLCAPRDRVQNHQFARTVNLVEELWQQVIERPTVVLHGRHPAVGERVSNAVAGWNSGEPELVEVARKRRLRDFPAPLTQVFPQLILALHRPGLHDLVDCQMSLAFIGHGLVRSPGGDTFTLATSSH